MYDFTPAYLKPPLQIRGTHLHKVMSPHVTGEHGVGGFGH